MFSGHNRALVNKKSTIKAVINIQGSKTGYISFNSIYFAADLLSCLNVNFKCMFLLVFGAAWVCLVILVPLS